MALQGINRFLRENSIETPSQKARRHWRQVFDKYDIDKNGYINVNELDELIKSQEYENDLPDHVVIKMHNLADTNHDGQLDFEEFVKMINHPALRPLFGSLVDSYVHILIPKESYTRPTAGSYNDASRCCPPPIGMFIISIIEIILYSVDAALMESGAEMGPVANALVYDPCKRSEVWRYITYMFVHIGVVHLVVNLCVQLFLGIPLELVHRWWRVLIIYFAGVLAGSLATSILDPTTKLAGASGGVYAIITAHIAKIIMNWKEMEYPFIQLFIFLIVTSCDLGYAIYDRYALNRNEHIGYIAHIAGAVAGLLMGINAVRNINVTQTEKVIWWISVVTYCALMGIAIIWNLAYTDYFPK